MLISSAPTAAMISAPPIKAAMSQPKLRLGGVDWDDWVMASLALVMVEASTGHKMTSIASCVS
jgi:hypothetical protein